MERQLCNLEDDTMSKQTERDAFRSRWGFILACIGSAVGMGNIWRFPYLVSAWGGMTFLLPYFLFVLLIGSTGIIGEMALGRSTRSGPIGAFGQAAALRGRRSTGEAVGYIPVLGSLALAIGYSCVVGWIFKYFALALDGGLFAMGQDMNVIVDRFNGTACGWGNNFWLVIALAVNFAIMAFGVGGGIERANKVMMPVLFFLFAGLGVYIATLPGAGDGYRYIFTLDPAGLADPKLWIYAFGQAFFSLSVAGNGTVIYGSYFSDDESIPSAARNVALFDFERAAGELCPQKLLEHIDPTLLRTQEDGFVDDVFTLLVGALACAIARTLKKPESFALERERMRGRIEIIKNGSAAVPEGGHRK